MGLNRACEEIAYAEPGQDVAGLTWIRFELASEAVDCYLEQVIITNIRFSPDILE